MTLEQISCIQYAIKFRKDKKTIQALINSDSEVNVIIPAYIAALGFKIWSTVVGAQKIDGFSFKIFDMVFLSFQFLDKLDRA